MKCFVLGFIFLAACSYADVLPLGCTTNVNTLSGMTQGNPVVGSSLSGCLTVDATSGGSNNVPGDGLYINPNNSGDPNTFQTAGLYVAYQVTNEGADVYQYEYTFAEPTANDDYISHILIGAGSGCTTFSAGANNTTPACVYNLQAYNLNGTSVGINYGAGDTFLSGVVSNGNPMIPWTGQALETLPNNPANTPPTVAPFGYTIVFDSNEAPAWENVYVRDGGATLATSNEAWNDGSNSVASGNSGLFVAGPSVQTPEASFYALFTMLMAGLFLFKWFSRKRSSSAA